MAYMVKFRFLAIGVTFNGGSSDPWQANEREEKFGERLVSKTCRNWI